MKKIFGIVLIALLIGLGIAFFTRIRHDRLALTRMRASFKCKSEMKTLMLALNEFRLIYDKYPTGTGEQIVASLKGANPSKRLFLEWPERGNTPIDPWGTTYRIEVNETNIRVSSAGPDQQFGTLDDRQTNEVPNEPLERNG